MSAVEVTEHAVVIAGAGPTGMMLAGELALAGVDVFIVERRASQEVDGSRAGGLHSRTIEVLDQRGIAGRFLSEGQSIRSSACRDLLDISDFPTRHNYVLALWQSRIEPILADWVEELGVSIQRRREVVGFTQDDTGVDVELSGGTTLRAQYLIGCDGGRSMVRKRPASTSGLGPDDQLPDRRGRDERGAGDRHAPEGGGIGPVNREEGGNPYGVVLLEKEIEHTGEPTMQDLRETLVAAYGTDYGVHSPSWISRFTDMPPGSVLARRRCSQATPHTSMARRAVRA